MADGTSDRSKQGSGHGSEHGAPVSLEVQLRRLADRSVEGSVSQSGDGVLRPDVGATSSTGSWWGSGWLAKAAVVVVLVGLVAGAVVWQVSRDGDSVDFATGPTGADDPGPPAGQTGPVSLWLNSRRFSTGGAQLVAAYVNSGEDEYTFGWSGFVDRWDGESWEPFRRSTMCPGLVGCRGNLSEIDADLARADIGIGVPPASQGGLGRLSLALRLEGMDAGWYRLRNDGHLSGGQPGGATVEAMGVFALVDGPVETVPFNALTEDQLVLERSVEPIGSIRAHLTVVTRSTEPQSTDASRRLEEALSSSVRVDVWRDGAWQRGADVPIHSGASEESGSGPGGTLPTTTDMSSEVTIVLAEPGAYRLVRTKADGTEVWGNLWAIDPRDPDGIGGNTGGGESVTATVPGMPDGSGMPAVTVTIPGSGGDLRTVLPPDEGPITLWLNSRRFPVSGGDLVTILRNTGETGATFGVPVTLERWDGTTWSVHRQAQFCVDHWHCNGRILPSNEGVIGSPDLGVDVSAPLIGLGAPAAATGGPLFLRVEGLEPGVYRLRSEGSLDGVPGEREPITATGTFEVVDGDVPELAPIGDLTADRIGIDPAIASAGPARKYFVVRAQPGQGSPESVAELDPLLDGELRIDRWFDGRWMPFAVARAERTISSDPMAALIEVDAPDPGSYRMVRTLSDGNELVGLFWVAIP